MGFRLKITLQARRDFSQIAHRIGRDNPQAAQDFGVRLLQRTESLTTFPYRHGVWAQEPHIRKVTFKPYVIFYKIHDDEKIVEILRFWHGARDQRRLRLKEEAGLAYGDPDEERHHLELVARRRKDAVTHPENRDSRGSGDERDPCFATKTRLTLPPPALCFAARLTTGHPMREQVTLECTEAAKEGKSPSRYFTTKNKKLQQERIERMKYNPALRRRTLHKEKK
jgi:large subunit ribosomal protein L33